jgi:hypothetical protein
LLASLCFAIDASAAPSSQPTSQPDAAPTTAPAPIRPDAQRSAPQSAPLGVAAIPQGPETHPAVRLGDPDQILEQLASPDWRVRRRAQEQLVRGGEDAKPFIHELIERAKTDEARKNAEAALAQIADNRLLGPSYITLHVKDAPASQVMAEISRQSFAPLQTIPDNLWKQESFPKLALDVDREPFWKVMPDVCQKLGIDFRPAAGGMRLMHTGGMRTEGVSEVDGAFLVVATGINYTRSKSFARQGEQSRFGMNLTVLPEPKLTVLRGAGTVSVDEAMDDKGNSLVPDKASAAVWGGYGGFGGWNLYVQLRYPKEIGTRLTRFKGSTSFLIQLESERVEIPDLTSLRPTTRLVHNLQATFEQMKKAAAGDVWQLHIRVDRPNFGGPEWQQFMDVAQNRLKVLDLDGNPLTRRGTSTNVNNNTVEMTLEFVQSTAGGRMTGPPSRLVWEVPTKTREITVPITFHDLPLFDDK